MTRSSRPRTSSRLSDSLDHQLNMLVLAWGAVTFILLVFGPMAKAQTFTDLYNFTGGSDGGNPYAGVVQDASGNLYGTTYFGGDLNCAAPYGCGVVFEVNTNGVETVLYTFTGSTDGASPHGRLLRDHVGKLYGTADNGGDLTCNAPYGCGVVFKVDTAGNETVLHTFRGGKKDGCIPMGGLIADNAGNFYGTTLSCGASNYGTVFKLTKKGREIVLHSFRGTRDGANPFFGNLLMDKMGNLYGVTHEGGSVGMGVVYKLGKNGALTVLHTFAGGSDGCFPSGTLAMDKAGSFYGTTELCGSSDNGTVWKLSKKGRETILHNFAGYPSDGANPYAGVVLDSKGNMYGDSVEGGPQGGGTLYQLSKSGTLTLLHSFSASDGTYPEDDLLRGPKGELYGTTLGSGYYYSGTVWSCVP